MTIVEDTSGRHDALCGATTRAANERRYGHGAVHGPSPAARELLTLAAAKHGLDRRDLPPCINLVQGRAGDGRRHARVRRRPATGPSFVQLRADLDVIVLLANSPHPLDSRPDYTGSIVRIDRMAAARHRETRSRPATTPERRRAYENTAHYVGRRGRDDRARRSHRGTCRVGVRAGARASCCASSTSAATKRSTSSSTTSTTRASATPRRTRSSRKATSSW